MFIYTNPRGFALNQFNAYSVSQYNYPQCKESIPLRAKKEDYLFIL
jgi:hypothetical protein